MQLIIIILKPHHIYIGDALFTNLMVLVVCGGINTHNRNTIDTAQSSSETLHRKPKLFVSAQLYLEPCIRRANNMPSL